MHVNISGKELKEGVTYETEELADHIFSIKNQYSAFSMWI